MIFFNILIICFLTIQTVVLILILLRFRSAKSDEFIIASNILDSVINAYYSNILFSKIENLKRNYDLNSESKTNAIKFFNEAYDDLIKRCSKDIIKVYLAKNCLSILLKYYTLESLTLYIITNLKLKGK